ncbi:Bug family tripartite tricarboxylate transporter substrate binding protein [Roseomonas xinghualingensis]|uniref:Bug family tripartite tricarboxylate transporter substrate binding protein n=1 Tax=Roseomonas xinghualingensis TaxID=2986475 RepID=UPI0021F19A7C|nr:tripartite tricarboxylate transporter substrate binding protein [Roseomonas sp. SXEYE001]MCV4207040.1 tripartite tricarboxylate transporter substrate binding protein [Roseomonas sp. SXEYE001]
MRPFPPLLRGDGNFQGHRPMRLPRRSLLAALSAPMLIPAGARAQASLPANWPDRPLRLILPYTPGGGTDTVARALGARLNSILGQTVVVENRPGAGGNLATELVAGARPDGYTLLMGNQGPITVNPTLFGRNLKVNPQAALDPVAMVAETPLVLVAGPGTRSANLAELIEEARARKGQLNYASPGNGAAGHLAMALLLQQAGVEATHVPFRGAAPGLTDVAAGHLAAMISTLPSVAGMVQGGALRALAVTSDRRVDSMPDIPTVAETLPGYRVTAWYGILVPHGTPEPIRARLESAILASLETEGLISSLRAEGAVPYPMKGEEFGRFIAAERERWAPVIRAAGITAD